MKVFQILNYCRPLNLAAMAVSQVVVYLHLDFSYPSLFINELALKIFLSTMAVVFIAAGGYWANDIFDTKIDRINHIEKIQVTDLFANNWLWLIYGVLTAVGLLFSFLLGWSPFACAIIIAFLLWIYSYFLKKTPLMGNITIAIISSFLIAFPALVLGLDIALYPSIYAYILFCLAASLIREIIKDAEDIVGDDANGCSTFPIWAGIRATKILIIVIIIFLMVLILYFTKDDLIAKRVYFWLMVVFPLLCLMAYIAKADHKKDFAKASVWAKGIMFTGLASMLFN